MKHKRLLVLCPLFCLSITGLLACDILNPTNKNSSSLFESSYIDEYSNSEGFSNSDGTYEVSATKEEVLAKGNKLTKYICEEGMVLLKNDDYALPLRQGSKVSVFGKNSVNPVFGGSGSTAPSDSVIKKGIYDSLDAEGIEYNPDLKSFYENNSLSGRGRAEQYSATGGRGILFETGETPYSSYTARVLNSYRDYNDAALVVISRFGGENFDLPKVAADNENRHYLELDNNERDLIRNIGSSGIFNKIILLLNTSHNIDLGFLYERTNSSDYYDFGKYIDGVLLVGAPGANGFMALGEILSGKVNPSGHLTETMYTNYKNDPVWQNFGAFNGTYAYNYLKDGSSTEFYLTEYEENIYMGYRYYETRGYIDGEEWYQSNVVYPFGYGLSYTIFDAVIVDASSSINDSPAYVDVKVTNVGNLGGKEVIQLYVEAPYTEGGIEKPYKRLIGFAKTDLLAPGQQEIVKITFEPYDFASFDAEDKNCNAFYGYELDAGDYVFHIASDAHNDIGTFTRSLFENVQYPYNPNSGKEVQPLFIEETEHMNVENSLSRIDFARTFPRSLTQEERLISNSFIDRLVSFESGNDMVFTEMPVTDSDQGISFASLVEKAYDDPSWDSFLSQLSVKEMMQLFNEGCYTTASIERFNIPQLTCSDGPTGFVAFLGDPMVYNTCFYCSEALLAQTYNLDIACHKGICIGNEALVGDEKNGNRPYSLIYAPALTLKRSPFNGRNTEYYSEDPFLTGMMASLYIQGAQSRGLTVAVKNFALNDQETSRSNNGLVTWCNEQAIRELYLKPFEMAVRRGDPRAFISSFNRIGAEWTGGSYRLLTKVLREEWGFRGMVLTDFLGDTYMNAKQALYAGGDIICCANKSYMLSLSQDSNNYIDVNNPTDVTMLRRAAHNVLYMIANSNAMVTYYREGM